MPSVRAIAKQLNLSPATVSRVLNNHPDVDEATRERVLARINEVGYVPRFGRRLTNVIALAYPDEPVRNEYGSFEPALLSGIMRGLGEHHFDLKLLSIRRDKSPDESYTQFFMRKGIRGVVLRLVLPGVPVAGLLDTTNAVDDATSLPLLPLLLLSACAGGIDGSRGVRGEAF